jgi:predicted ATP-grasp superfamily ATP-dependent carboligase
MKIQLNSLAEIHDALQKDLITPNMAELTTIKALNMWQISFGEKQLSKEYVLKQILRLEYLIKEDKVKPLHFNQQNVDFIISEIIYH